MRISSGPMPRVVSAGVPMRMPLPCRGGRSSYGIVLRFTVMATLSQITSALRPLIPFAPTSTSIRWLSVPPETSR